MTIIKQLIGHTSEDTAYLVADYPYGYTTRTSIRYWVETKGKHGQRFVSQTLNPKTGKWNKAKASTYRPVIVIGLNEEDHIQYAATSYYDNESVWQEFQARFVLDDFQTKAVNHFVRVRLQYKAKEAELLAAGLPSQYSDVVKACITDDIATLKAGKELV